MIRSVITIFVGLAGGLAVGGSIVAFFTVLGVITRIVELVRGKKYLRYCQLSIVAGAVISSLTYFFNLHLLMSVYFTIPVGLFMGIFIGMIAAALTETLDIISTAASTLGIVRWIYLIIIAIIAGKALGSALYWIIPGFY